MSYRGGRRKRPQTYAHASSEILHWTAERGGGHREIYSRAQVTDLLSRCLDPGVWESTGGGARRKVDGS